MKENIYRCMEGKDRVRKKLRNGMRKKDRKEN
jgi:hypothetical protein